MGEEANDFEVELAVEMVQPAEEKTERHGQLLFLSNLDQVVLYPIETVYFYPAPVGGTATPDISDLSARLRRALAILLVPYDFMAGRLRLNHSVFRLELLCNNAGVLFGSATADANLADLGDVTLPNPAFTRLVLQVHHVACLAELPLTTVQVTRFKCGGFTIGFSSNHVLLDGVGAGEFLSSYASLVRGETISLWPKADRTMLKARCPPLVEFDHHEYVWLPGERFSEQADPLCSYTEMDALAAATSQGHALMDYAYKAFHVQRKVLAQLKKEGSGPAESNGQQRACTAFEALAAHLWQCKTKASSMEASKFSTFLFAVDIRRIMQPPLPFGFAGNAVLSACARAEVEELLNSPLSYAVKKVQEARAQVNDSYVRSAIDCLEMNKGLPLTSSGYYVSAWTKVLQHQNLDFGWGPPIHVTPVVSALVDFVLFVSDGSSSDGLFVLVAMPPAHLTKFQEVFLQVGPNGSFFPYV
ncbi:hypothetical protein KP509_02G033000 [Ceratopteris richardii]|uniref:BAHD family acyltransferase, clade V n=1 Tax=Ceratopteris richardii TaxID=49495 RepID=A0A8T2V846_CERRI|nr:hypothetical protein KP509_02G033000 [Ceratopteris richardii]